jgi:nucleotide-binding universal stress UspA family protein
MYQRILVPLDGSVTSMHALEEAVKLARLTGGRLRLLHVSDVLAFATGFETYALYKADVLPTMKRAGEHILDEGKARARSHGIEADSVLTESLGPSVAEVVAEQALQWHADLVVIGTHGRRGAARLLMGSDAEQIARRMPVPVLLVRWGPSLVESADEIQRGNDTGDVRAIDHDDVVQLAGSHQAGDLGNRRVGGHGDRLVGA